MELLLRARTFACLYVSGRGWVRVLLRVLHAGAFFFSRFAVLVRCSRVCQVFFVFCGVLAGYCMIYQRHVIVCIRRARRPAACLSMDES